MCRNTAPLTHLQEPQRLYHVPKHSTINILTRIVRSSSTMCRNTTRLKHLQELQRFDHVRKYNMIKTLTRTVVVRPCAETQRHRHTYKNRSDLTMYRNTTPLTQLQEQQRFDHVQKHNTMTHLQEMQWFDHVGKHNTITHSLEPQQFDHVRKHNTIDTLTRTVVVQPCVETQHH